MIIPNGASVFVATQPVDFRKGATGLMALVQDGGADPFSGALYVFRSRRADRVKMVWWDGGGVCLFAKTLDEAGFHWPRIENSVIGLTAAQLMALVEGMDWERRETDGRQRVQVPYDEGVANHIGPESCAGGREAAREALTGARVGQP